MNTDFRVAVDFFSHHKARKLKKRLGADGVMALLQLWAYAAKLRTDGDLAGMTIEDIELAADWGGDDGALVTALHEVGFLDKDGDAYALHDWLENNAWAAGAESRSDASRLSRMARTYLAAGFRFLGTGIYKHRPAGRTTKAVGLDENNARVGKQGGFPCLLGSAGEEKRRCIRGAQRTIPACCHARGELT